MLTSISNKDALRINGVSVLPFIKLLFSSYLKQKLHVNTNNHKPLYYKQLNSKRIGGTNNKIRWHYAEKVFNKLDQILSKLEPFSILQRLDQGGYL